MRTTLSFFLLLSVAAAAPNPTPEPASEPTSIPSAAQPPAPATAPDVEGHAAPDVEDHAAPRCGAHQRCRQGRVQFAGVRLHGAGVQPIQGALHKQLTRLKRHIELKYRKHLKAGGQAQGMMTFKFRLTPVGSPIALAIKESTLKSPELEQVVRRTINEARYPQAKAGPVIVEVGFHFKR
ncbi:AgmX/PglI C-terminal domain-containing protein [Myxococcota bacterium]|nr:AgmX/PglI C-terminal domain-containing protein [Myxococcota bacterium]MBU1431396.1 AgmX/PglI C-terminal domain-containing protein [Myxococcota bacterium]MBU1900517.1 AgmX/PglI C-terminal domain-containing protein [Myxococcota bacterium]